MIKSISFPKRGKGYLYRKLQKPEAPSKSFIGKRGGRVGKIYTKEDYDADLLRYKEELNYYKEHKGEYELGCSKNLVGKTFKFEQNKINILFGPNASGKSTVLQTIAGHALIERDGFARLCPPAAYDFSDFLKEDKENSDKESRIDQYVFRLSKNTSDMIWDGSPVYYHNFENLLYHLKSTRGSLCEYSPLINSAGEELDYFTTRDVISQGQNAVILLQRVLSLLSKPTSFSELFKNEIASVNGTGKYMNNTWVSVYKEQLDYLKSFENFDVISPVTILFDEIDKSLDTLTVWYLYTELLPKFIEKTGSQIILVSHNPLAMMRSIRLDKSMFNIISVDENYTQEFLCLMEGQLF